ncbi:MAG TPA: hypothetical protein PLB25_05175 [Rhodoferax sp.]|nr:hypothetical protein [Rhodoferax sp.]
MITSDVIQIAGRRADVGSGAGIWPDQGDNSMTRRETCELTRLRHGLAGTKSLVFSSLLSASEFFACAAMASSAMSCGIPAGEARFAA